MDQNGCCDLLAAQIRHRDLHFHSAQRGRGQRTQTAPSLTAQQYGSQTSENARALNCDLLFRSGCAEGCARVSWSSSFFPSGTLLPTCPTCHCPRYSLLDSVAAAHPDVFGVVKNSGQKSRSGEIPVCGNVLQQLQHPVEITPHHDSAERAAGSRVLL